MKRLDSLIIWLVILTVYLVVTYFYNRSRIKKFNNRPRHTRKEKEAAKSEKRIEIKFFRCIFYLDTRKLVGNGLFINNLIFLILLIVQILLLVLYVFGVFVYNDIVLVAVNCVLLFYVLTNFIFIIKDWNKK